METENKLKPIREHNTNSAKGLASKSRINIQPNAHITHRKKAINSSNSVYSNSFGYGGNRNGISSNSTLPVYESKPLHH